MLRTEAAGIEFDRFLCIFGEREMTVDHCAKTIDLLGAEKIRRATAEMELHCLALRPEMQGKDLQFLFKEIEVVRRLVAVQRGDRVATAKPAERLAERKVEVKRQRRITLLHPSH